MDNCAGKYDVEQSGGMMMFLMGCVLFAYVFCSMILFLKISWKYKLAAGLVMFAIAQKNGILRRLGGGLFFAPELPRWVLIAVAFLYGVMFFSAAFLLFKDLFVLWIWKLLEYKKIVKVKFKGGIAALVILALAVLFSAYSLYEGLRHPPVRYVEMHFERLPLEFDGFKVAVIADLHASALNRASFVEEVVDLTVQEKPDIIVLPGDIIDGRVSSRAEDVVPLAKLTAPWGVYAAPGNHEYYSEFDEWMAQFASLNLRMLINDSVELKKGDSSIFIGGIADRSAAKRNREAPDITKTWRNVKPGAFRILLAHQVKDSSVNAENDTDLQISGHTHGGMIIGMDKLLVGPSNDGFVRGEYDVGKMKLYVSAGASLWSGFPLRFGVPSEITIIVLRCK